VGRGIFSPKEKEVKHTRELPNDVPHDYINAYIHTYIQFMHTLRISKRLPV
jgi:hypothetical protein